MDSHWTWKSRICPNLVQKNIVRLHFLTLDNDWTNIGLGHTLDRDKFHFLISGEFTILDSLWTNFEHGRRVDKHCKWTNLGQCLDIVANTNALNTKVNIYERAPSRFVMYLLILQSLSCSGKFNQVAKWALAHRPPPARCPRLTQNKDKQWTNIVFGQTLDNVGILQLN